MADNPNPTEDLGYAFVQETCARSNAIWRRLAEKDICLDGLIELRRRDGASAMLGVQVKSGKSYFRRRRPGSGFVVDLRRRLADFSQYTVPVLVILYDPDKRVGYWAHVQEYVAEHPSCIDGREIEVSPDRHFDRPALDDLRNDTQLVRCPCLPEPVVREFLEINGRIDLAAFVELARNVLNTTAFCCRTGIAEIEFLREHGLVSHAPNPDGGPGFWTPTSRGRDYVYFMLGDRYFIPLVLMKPSASISDDDITMCMDFGQYIANTRTSATAE